MPTVQCVGARVFLLCVVLWQPYVNPLGYILFQGDPDNPTEWQQMADSCDACIEIGACMTTCNLVNFTKVTRAAFALVVCQRGDVVLCCGAVVLWCCAVVRW